LRSRAGLRRRDIDRKKGGPNMKFIKTLFLVLGVCSLCSKAAHPHLPALSAAGSRRDWTLNSSSTSRAQTVG